MPIRSRNVHGMGFSRAGSRLEDSVHALAEPVARALGYRPHTIAYRGYGTGERVRILARVLLRRETIDDLLALEEE